MPFVMLCSHNSLRVEFRPRNTYRGTSLIRNRHPPTDHRRALGIGLL